MIISLMRESLRKLISGNLKDAHAGLLMQRGLPEWNQDDKQAKEDLIEKIAKIPAPAKDSLYALAFTRWVQATSDTSRFATLTASISGRLYTGLNSAGALETGISTHHTYGMPLIAGSSVKGIARSYAESLGLDKAYLTVLFGDDSDSGSLKAGALVWHDAWFVPASTQPFAAEIITTHHQDYYNGKQLEADEMESPIPNQQIATQGSFYFAIECAPGAQAWAVYAQNLLFQALQTQGAGSKTASGYGYFTEADEAARRSIRSIQDAQNQARAAQQKAAKLAAMPAHRQFIQTWQDRMAAHTNMTVGNQAHDTLYKEWKAALQTAAESPDFNAAEKAEIAAEFAVKKMEQAYKNWLTGKRPKELKPILAKLRGE
ncbi:RAMP superfamily CRISPR-associated protein [Eikenella corrodens]|uniref:RAMP superfamily CRISPR-associated protein n=1 Tax=Eikenella corrodens TaxID=539 RepID=UPI0006650CAC|nr:RAMP superfamily CRISPR-associated protein [Eikenella corrodens]